MRLMAWSSLERTVQTPSARNESRAGKVAELASAQTAGQVGEAFPPDFLLTAVMTLATAWSAVSPFGPSLAPESAERPDTLRANIARAVDLIATAKADGA
jgi:hypothetical protein